jgi:hypothetical protein
MTSACAAIVQKRHCPDARHPVESAFPGDGRDDVPSSSGNCVPLGRLLLAVLFAIRSLLISLDNLIFGEPIFEAWVFTVLSVVCWIWGWLMRFECRLTALGLSHEAALSSLSRPSLR